MSDQVRRLAILVFVFGIDVQDNRLIAVSAGIAARLAQQIEHLVRLLSGKRWQVFLLVADLHWLIERHAISGLQGFFAQQITTMSANESKVQDRCQDTRV